MHRIAAGRSPVLEPEFVSLNLIGSVNKWIPEFRNFILEGADCYLPAANIFYGYVEPNANSLVGDIAEKLKVAAQGKANNGDALVEMATPYFNRLLDWYKETVRGENCKTKKSQLVEDILGKDLKDVITSGNIAEIRRVLLGLFVEDELSITASCTLLLDYLRYLALALNYILSNRSETLAYNLSQAKDAYVRDKENTLLNSFEQDCHRSVSLSFHSKIDSIPHFDDSLQREGASPALIKNTKLNVCQSAIISCLPSTMSGILNGYPVLSSAYRKFVKVAADGEAVRMFAGLTYNGVVFPSDMGSVYGIDLLQYGIDMSRLESGIYTSETPLFTIYSTDKINADNTQPESIAIEVFHPLFKQIFASLPFAKLRLGTPYAALSGGLKDAVDELARAVVLPVGNNDFPVETTPNNLLCYAVQSSENALALFNHPKTLARMYSDPKFFSTHQLSYRKIVEKAIEDNQELKDIKADLDKIAVEPITAAKVKSDKKAAFAAFDKQPKPKPGKETTDRAKERAALTTKWERTKADQVARAPAVANRAPAIARIQRRLAQAGTPEKVFGLLAYYNDEELRVLTSQVEITSRLTTDQILLLAKRDSVVAKQLLKPTWNFGNTFNYLRHASKNLSPAQVREVLDCHPSLIHDRAFSAYVNIPLLRVWLISGDDVQKRAASYKLINNDSLARDFFDNAGFAFSQLAALYVFCKGKENSFFVLDQIKSTVRTRQFTGANINFADKNQVQFFREVVLANLSDDKLVDALMNAYNKRAAEPDSNYDKNVIPVYWNELLQRQKANPERGKVISEKLSMVFAEFLYYKKINAKSGLTMEDKTRAITAFESRLRTISQLLPPPSADKQEFPAHVSMLLKLPEVREFLAQDESEAVRSNLYRYQETEALFDLAMELENVRKDLENAASDSAHPAKPLLDAVVSDADKFAEAVMGVLKGIDPNANGADVKKLKFLTLNTRLFDTFIEHANLPDLVNYLVRYVENPLARILELSKKLGSWAGTDEEYAVLKKEHESLKKDCYYDPLMQKLLAKISNPTPAFLARLLNDGEFSTENIADYCLAFPKLVGSVYTHEKLVELLKSKDITRILALTKAANSTDFAKQIIYILISYPDIREQLIAKAKTSDIKKTQEWVKVLLSQLDENKPEHKLLVALLQDDDGNSPVVSVSDICEELTIFQNSEISDEKTIKRYKHMAADRLSVLLRTPSKLEDFLKDGKESVIRWLFQRMQSATSAVAQDAVSKFVSSIAYEDIKPETFRTIAFIYFDYVDTEILKELLRFPNPQMLDAIQGKIRNSSAFALLTQMLLVEIQQDARAARGIKDSGKIMQYYRMAMHLDIDARDASHRDYFKQMQDVDFLEIVRLCDPYDLLFVLETEIDPIFVGKLTKAIAQLFDVEHDGANACLFKTEVLDNLPLALAACKLNENGGISKAILEQKLDELLTYRSANKDDQWFLIKTALLTGVIDTEEFYAKLRACDIERQATNIQSMVIAFVVAGGDISSLRGTLVPVILDYINTNTMTADLIVNLCQHFPIRWLQAAASSIEETRLGEIVGIMQNHDYTEADPITLDGLTALFGDNLTSNHSFNEAVAVAKAAPRSPRDSMSFELPDDRPAAAAAPEILRQPLQVGGKNFS